MLRRLRDLRNVRKSFGLTKTKSFMILKVVMRSPRCFLRRREITLSLQRHSVLAKRLNSGMLLMTISCTISMAYMSLVQLANKLCCSTEVLGKLVRVDQE